MGNIIHVKNRKTEVKEAHFKFEPFFSRAKFESIAAEAGRLKNKFDRINLASRYFGCELEVECKEGADVAELLPIPDKFLKGRYIWKYDGSIGYGAELVTDAMTLNRWKEVNLKGLCDALKKKATSYEKGTCGFHIHVNLQSLKPGAIQIAQGLLANNVDFFKRFSKRESFSYCNFGSTQRARTWLDNGRYSALNPTTNTLEFRLWRGTLNHDRLRASLQLTDAVCSYSNQISRASCCFGVGRDGWRVQDFRRWEGLPGQGLDGEHFEYWFSRRPEYQALTKYLKGQKLHLSPGRKPNPRPLPPIGKVEAVSSNDGGDYRQVDNLALMDALDALRDVLPSTASNLTTRTADVCGCLARGVLSGDVTHFIEAERAAVSTILYIDSRISNMTGGATANLRAFRARLRTLLVTAGIRFDSGESLAVPVSRSGSTHPMFGTSV